MLSPRQTFGQTPSRGQFTFGPQDKSNLITQNFEFQQSTEHGTPKSHENKGVLNQFDVIYTLRNPGQEVRIMVEKLDQGCYLFFKYFIVVMSILNVCGALANLINLFHLVSFLQLVPILGGTFFASWNAYQLLLLYKGMSLKDYNYAQSAVILMKWYMILSTIILTLSFIFVEPSLWIPQIQEINGIKYILAVVLITIVIEIVFFGLFLFGAIKVRNLLKEINDILEGSNYVNQRT